MKKKIPFGAMEAKQNGQYLSNVQQSSAPQKQLPPVRSSSLLGISRYSDDGHSYNDYYDRDITKYDKDHSVLRSSHITRNNNPTLQYDRLYPNNMSSIVEGGSPSDEEENAKENYSGLVKLQNKNSTHEIFEYNEPWLCDIDLFREKLRAQHLLINGTYRRSLERQRYSESAKDVSPSLEQVRRRIRARSESEPNDISSMRQWREPSNLFYNRDDSLLKRTKENDYISTQENGELQNYRNEAAQQRVLGKKESPPRVLIYNHTPRSPALLKKSMRFRSSPVLNSPRMNAMRKFKTKSQSPSFRGRTLLSPASPLRKSKSVTPPPPSLKLPIQPTINRTISQQSSDKQDTDDANSSLGDDDDFDDEVDDGDDIHSSSDSENGYKSNIYLTDSDKSLSPSPLAITQAQQNKGAYTSPFVSSLFPYVPPYLTFSSHTEKGPPIAPQLQKILKWKLTTIMPRVVRRILINSGFRLLKKTNDWMGTWGKHMKSPCFKTIRSYQKINHLPGSFKIGRKDSCWRNLQTQMLKHGKKEFGFMPKTYVIPQDLKLLRKAWPKYSQRNFKWIIKPPASARGTGIKVINRWSQIPKRKPIIVQKYIERPLLINGSKFDLRLYVLVTSINPLRVYMYNDGLARFASVKYSDKSDTLSDRCMHLTNYSINKLSSNYARNEDANACQGHKWTIKSLWSYLAGRGVNTHRLWGALRNLVLRTILAGENAIHTMIKLNVESKYNCFELFGFDVILDSELIPWLLEVNISPSLHSELPLDLHVKAPLVQAVFNTALYHVPPKLSSDQQKNILAENGLQGPLCYDKRLYITYLSRAEKLKHNQFTRKALEDRDDYLNAILENLTPDDVRCLITTEDELARCSPLERIFPSANTHKYLKYTDTPRYYNRLLDAWENRYSKNRSAGIRYLRELCEQKFHLEVPPAPVKKQLKIRTRTITKVQPSSGTTTRICWALTTAVNSIKRRQKKQNVTRLIIKTKSKPASEIVTEPPPPLTTTTTTTTTLPAYQLQQQ